MLFPNLSTLYYRVPDDRERDVNVKIQKYGRCVL